MIDPYIPNKLLDHYEFLLREDEKQYFKHTGTPSFYILIKNKTSDSTEYKQIPHGKGGCILSFGNEQKTFVFDDLYNILIPVIGDENIIQKWKDKIEAEKEIKNMSAEYKNGKDIILIETIIEAQKEDLISILKEENKEEYLAYIKEHYDGSELIASKINDNYIYIINEGTTLSRLNYFIISSLKKKKEDVLVDVFDYYNYIDGLIQQNEQKYKIPTTTDYLDID